MANDPELARKLLQVFCGGAGEQQTSVFGTMKNTTPEYSTDPDVLQGSNWPQGWQNAVAADDAPFMEDMNSLFYVMSYLVKYLYQHGVAEWNNKETYTALKSIVFSNGKLYVAKQSTGADNPQDPATDSSNTYWYLALDPVNPPASQNWVQGYAQSLANLSQAIDSSTSKYPSNKAVQDYSAKIDLSNAIPAQSFKDMITGWNMPSTRFINITEPENNNSIQYTAPANGYVYYNRVKSAGATAIAGIVNNTTAISCYNSPYAANAPATCIMEVKKGEIVTISRQNLTGTLDACRFYYKEGN